MIFPILAPILQLTKRVDIGISTWRDREVAGNEAIALSLLVTPSALNCAKTAAAGGFDDENVAGVHLDGGGTREGF